MIVSDKNESTLKKKRKGNKHLNNIHDSFIKDNMNSRLF